MLSVNLQSPQDIARLLAGRVRERRLAANLTQQGLAVRAGVSLGSLKRFERIGAISLESLIRIALALGAAEEFTALFRPWEFQSLDEVIAAPPKRLRGRHM